MTWKIGLPEKESEAILRGCIGTFSKGNLKTNLGMYAMISAFQDSRFPPITLKEVPLLNCTVSLLQDFEPIKDPFDWVVGKHGIQIKFRSEGTAEP